MRVKCMVIAASHDKSKKDGRMYETLTCLDSDTGDCRMKNTFDYGLSQRDVEKFPDTEALVNQTIELAVTEVRPGFGGREKFSGHILTPPVLSKAKG